MSPEADVLTAALNYIARGWSPVDMPRGTKRLLREGWQNERLDAAAARIRFNGARKNVGLILGAPSDGLTDADLDCAEAIEAAGHFLPETLCFGRPGAPRSHWEHRTDLAKTEGIKAIEYRDLDGVMLCELRIGQDEAGLHSAYTVFPPSIHDTGEPIEWCGCGVSGGDGMGVTAREIRLGFPQRALVAPAFGRRATLSDAAPLGPLVSGCRSAHASRQPPALPELRSGIQARHR
jgi:Bifunctional DNA primase/polymerase, N-terminal